ncbi:hypothetical protein AB0M43_06520 [Longispora sp. NPDC051575]|uniref:3-hydroxyacyl-ACP dehydratase FabZ family protein n=1 Tax=Longispora sp. NPDC051575 TaxID=3154943 RepID=UPI0034471EDE
MATPLAAPVVVVEHGEHHAVTSLTVDPADPIFAGHYPDFPIYPGVCLVEFVNASAHALALMIGREVELTGVESVRFHHPVFPGDTVTARVDLVERAGGWRCSAALSSGDTGIATVRLAYRTGTEE